MQNQDKVEEKKEDDPKQNLEELDEMEKMMSQLFGGLRGPGGSFPAGNLGSDP